MALFLFTKAILNNEEINIYNHGKMTRDFTYIDDIIESLSRIIDKVPESDKISIIWHQIRQRVGPLIKFLI